MNLTQKKLLEERAFFETLGKIYPASPKVQVIQETIAAVNCYWLTPKDSPYNTIAIYLHGGSFVMGSIKSHHAMVSHMAAHLETKILFVEYALAPEKPFPNAVNDVLKVYKILLQKHAKKNIVFIGDSAGGGLLVSAIHAASRENIPLPAGVMMISPWLNLRCNNPSFESRKNLDPILTKETLLEHARDYAGTQLSMADPSQLSFHAFPPSFLLVGSDEILYDDTDHFFKTVRKIQPNTKMKEYQKKVHVWFLTDMVSDTSYKALNDMKDFIAETSGAAAYTVI